MNDKTNPTNPTNPTTVTLRVSGRYRSATTTVRAKRGPGAAYLEISHRQMQEAASRCCYAGADWPVLPNVPGYGPWVPRQDGSLLAWQSEEG